MNKKTKITVLSLVSVCAAGVMTIALLNNKAISPFAAEVPCSGNHYIGTDINSSGYGVRPYYACCQHHEIYLNAPSEGTWTENGTVSSYHLEEIAADPSDQRRYDIEDVIYEKYSEGVPSTLGPDVFADDAIYGFLGWDNFVPDRANKTIHITNSKGIRFKKYLLDNAWNAGYRSIDLTITVPTTNVYELPEGHTCFHYVAIGGNNIGWNAAGYWQEVDADAVTNKGTIHFDLATMKGENASFLDDIVFSIRDKINGEHPNSDIDTIIDYDISLAFLDPTVTYLKNVLIQLPSVGDYEFNGLGDTFEAINGIYSTYSNLSEDSKALFTSAEVAKINGLYAKNNGVYTVKTLGVNDIKGGSQQASNTYTTVVTTDPKFGSVLEITANTIPAWNDLIIDDSEIRPNAYDNLVMFVYNPTNTAREVYGFGGGPVYENLVTTIDAESWGMIQFPKSSVAALNGLEFALGKPGQNFKDLTGWKFSKILAASDAGVAYLPNLVYGATVNPLKTTLASLPAVADYSFDSLGTTFETINSLYASYNALSAGAKSLFTADEVAKINGLYDKQSSVSTIRAITTTTIKAGAEQGSDTYVFEAATDPLFGDVVVVTENTVASWNNLKIDYSDIVPTLYDNVVICAYNPTSSSRDVYGFGPGGVYDNIVGTIAANSWGIIQFPASSTAGIDALNFSLGQPGVGYKNLIGWKFSKLFNATTAGITAINNVIYGPVINPIRETLATLPEVSDYTFNALGEDYETINEIYASYNALPESIKNSFTSDEVNKITGLYNKQVGVYTLSVLPIDGIVTGGQRAGDTYTSIRTTDSLMGKVVEITDNSISQWNSIAINLNVVPSNYDNLIVCVYNPTSSDRDVYGFGGSGVYSNKVGTIAANSWGIVQFPESPASIANLEFALGKPGEGYNDLVGWKFSKLIVATDDGLTAIQSIIDNQ